MSRYFLFTQANLVPSGQRRAIRVQVGKDMVEGHVTPLAPSSMLASTGGCFLLETIYNDACAKRLVQQLEGEERLAAGAIGLQRIVGVDLIGGGPTGK